MPRVTIHRTAKDIVAEAGSSSSDSFSSVSLSLSASAFAYLRSGVCLFFTLGLAVGLVRFWLGLGIGVNVGFAGQMGVKLGSIIASTQLVLVSLWATLASWCPFSVSVQMEQQVAPPPTYWEFLGPPPAYYNESTTFELSCQNPASWERSGIPSQKEWTQVMLTSYWLRRGQTSLVLTPMLTKVSTQSNYPVAHIELQNYSGGLAKFYLKHASGATWSLEQVWNAQRCQLEIPYLPSGPFVLQASAYHSIQGVVWSNMVELHVKGNEFKMLGPSSAASF